MRAVVREEIQDCRNGDEWDMQVVLGSVVRVVRVKGGPVREARWKENAMKDRGGWSG